VNAARRGEPLGRQGFGHADHSSRDRRDAISSAVPVWSKIFRSMTVTSSSRVLSGGTTVTARNVGDWKGAARAAQSTANRAHFSNLASSASI
jgi:hypothetical protein